MVTRQELKELLIIIQIIILQYIYQVGQDSCKLIIMVLLVI